jgi:hypothetical protein
VKFKSLLIEDQKKRLKDKSINCEIINISEIKNIEKFMVYIQLLVKI